MDEARSQRAIRLLGRSNNVSFRMMTRRSIRSQNWGVNETHERCPLEVKRSCALGTGSKGLQ